MAPAHRDVHGLLAETLMRQQKFDDAVVRVSAVPCRPPE